MSLRDYATLRSISCLTCSIRLEQSPKKLLCHHRFCLQCLTLLLSTDNTRNMVTCPVCQHTTPVLNGNISFLDTDVELQSRIQGITNLRQLCTNCELTHNNTAEFYCDVCSLFLCRICMDDKHNALKSTRSHYTFLVDDIRKGKVCPDNKIPCRNHSGDERRHVCTLVCMTCKKAICEECNRVVHSEHNVQKLTEYKTESHAQSESVQNKAALEVENAKRRMESAMNAEITTSNYINNVIGSTRGCAATTVKEIGDREDSLIKICEDHKQTITQNYQKIKKEDDRMSTQLESAIELLRTNTSCQFGADTVAIRASLIHCIRTILAREIVEIEYKKRLDDITKGATQIKFTPDKNRLLLGHVTFNDNASSFPESIQHGNGSPEYSTYIPRTIRRASCSTSERWTLRKNTALPAESPMQCLASTPNGKVAVGTKRTGIMICSTRDTSEYVERKPGIPQISAVSGLAFTSKGNCVVRTRCNRIAMFTADWDKLDVKFQTIMTTWTFLKKGPCGNITVDGDDYIYVNHIKDRKIEVFPVTGGKALRTIPYRGFKAQDIFAMKSRKILAVSSGDQSVSLIDECGCIKKRIRKDGENVFCALRSDDSILLARVRRNASLLTIEHYSQDLEFMDTIISDHNMKVPTKPDWFAMQETLSGDIAFCTSESLYLFSKSYM